MLLGLGITVTQLLKILETNQSSCKTFSEARVAFTFAATQTKISLKI
jgi:hypothetical protein